MSTQTIPEWKAMPSRMNGEMLSAAIEALTLPRDGMVGRLHAIYGALWAASPTPPEAPGWRPIETAPRDGTNILLLTAGGVVEGYWQWGDWSQSVIECSYDEAGGPVFGCRPTHWMPLPPAPGAAPPEQAAQPLMLNGLTEAETCATPSVLGLSGAAQPADVARLVEDVTVDDLLAIVRAEVVRATDKFPTWPTDPLHASGVVQEESGELAKAVLQRMYEPHKSTDEDVRTEAVQTAAMAVRFLLSMDRYLWQPGEQHAQNALAAQGASHE